MNSELCSVGLAGEKTSSTVQDENPAISPSVTLPTVKQGAYEASDG